LIAAGNLVCAFDYRIKVAILIIIMRVTAKRAAYAAGAHRKAQFEPSSARFVVGSWPAEQYQGCTVLKEVN
jgi:hypothetical protein